MDKKKQMFLETGKIFSISIVAAVFFHMVFHPYWESNDDFWMGNLVAGVLGETSNFMYFVHHLIGTLLEWLYIMFPGFSWIGILWTIIIFLGFTAILKCFRENTGPVIGSILWATSLFLFGYAFYVKVNFTRVAAIACVAGYLLVFSGLRKKSGYWDIVLGMVLCWTGFMVRYEAAYFATALCGGIGLAEVFSGLNLKEGPAKLLQRLKEKKRYFVVFAILFIGVGALLMWEKAWINADPDRKAFDQLNLALSDITDYWIKDVQQAEAELETLDLSPVVYEALSQKLIHFDPEYITQDTIAKAQGVQNNSESLDWKVLREGVQSTWNTLKNNRIYTNVWVCVMIALLFSAKRRWGIIFWELIIMHGLNLYLTICGRTVDRVTESICALSGIIILWSVGEVRKYSRKRVMAGGLAVILLLTAVFNDSFYLDPATYDKREMLEELKETMDDIDALGKTGRYYWTSAAHLDALIYRVGMQGLNTLEPGQMEHILIAGGWVANLPVYKAQLDKAGIVNPYRELFTRDDLLMIGKYKTGELFWYLENLYPEQMASANWSICGKMGPYTDVIGFAQNMETQELSKEIQLLTVEQLAGEEEDLVWFQIEFEGPESVLDPSNVYYLNLLQDGQTKTYRAEAEMWENHYRVLVGVDADAVLEGEAQLTLLHKDQTGKLERCDYTTIRITKVTPAPQE